MSTPRTEGDRSERPLVTFPESIVEVLGSGEFPEDAPLIKQYDDGSVRRSLFTKDEAFVGIGTMQFGVESKQFAEINPPHYNRVDFCYKQGDVEVAYMDFRILPDGAFELNHRYVHPDFRGKGIGERLLANAQQAFQHLADQRQAPVDIKLQGGQRRTLQWFLDRRRGFVPADEDSASIVIELSEHPEQFIFEDIGGPGDASDKVDCMFRPETTGRTIKDTVRVNLKKTFLPRSTSEQ